MKTEKQNQKKTLWLYVLSKTIYLYILILIFLL